MAVGGQLSSGRSCGESLWQLGPYMVNTHEGEAGGAASHSCAGCSLPKGKVTGKTKSHSLSHIPWHGCACPEWEALDSCKSIMGQREPCSQAAEKSDLIRALGQTG